MTGSAIHKSTAVIDNGPFGKVNIRFETGRLAQQAGGAVQAFLDDETMVLSATTAGKEPKCLPRIALSTWHRFARSGK